MSGMTIDVLVHAGGTATRQQVTVNRLVIAGWTGRDPVARDKHIAELEALGIPRPATTPIYYEVAARRLTTSDAIEVSGADSSGEVEFVLVKAGGRLLLGVGSDHTDRKVETYNITVSKQICDKPVAPELWLVDDVLAHWDQLVLRAYATIGGERVLYQEGALSGMLAPADLIARRYGEAGLPEGTAMFGGTFAAKGGIRPADRFAYELVDPVLNRSIRHGYAIEQRVIAG
ncbi:MULTISPECIES: DUF2848 domain-containing protein [Bradyrhizobium]|jgi:hypothetical protein|uniref:DUF2848 domain-containing protein n=1 Tax=Bradyrhizobium denitrificans TaxID=2734912 RepID=A0ABS5G153_9BRAD|nr:MULTISPECIES: DUF2848 domain-containing protein [Bradyrhizobium]RTM06150.1 MAG: DUF2848 domain-containing protein [Bradyrhizobiaceae bacterium]ABQ32792.1 hypothetical protein BBta_0510 [Bradyrhizobium sp. BTAi1]MBR1135019.1 DUF2848 domain-containing protein [Bradyrhizobium denitrificans]MCL8488522.1 DUF2848 domain-containing protein [Bradyrhizobium denitrificans]MDU0960133.1 DUF2848 domain-containing protein [Bradyrhizobium sp.]